VYCTAPARPVWCVPRQRGRHSQRRIAIVTPVGFLAFPVAAALCSLRLCGRTEPPCIHFASIPSLVPAPTRPTTDHCPMIPDRSPLSAGADCC